MATATSVDYRGVVFRRARENRIHAWLLGGLLFLTLAPFVGGVSYVLANMIVVRVRPDARIVRSQIRTAESYLNSASSTMDLETRQAWERVIQKKRAALERDQASNGVLLAELIALFATVQIGAMALLFWSIAADPMSKLLVEAGASPAGASGKEIRESLETLALSAGLPPPKLFIAESSVPNAFAAGIGPHQAVVVVTRGAMALLNQREMEGLLAHELSHIGNRDLQLNAVVAAIALFLRIPYVLFQRELRAGKQQRVSRRRSPWRLAVSPVGLYVLFVAPLVAAVIRASVSRGRELEADADAVKLTGTAQGLMIALAKIGGSGSVMAGANPAFAHFYFASPTEARGWLGGSMMATHPPMAERIQTLAAETDPATLDQLKEAIQAGRRYTREHPPSESAHTTTGNRDELTSFNRGNPMGRVHRVISRESVPVYETASLSAPVLARVKSGALLVAFDDPGKMRQINTADQTFGYIERSVRLAPMNLIPEELYDPAARAAAEAALPPLDAAPMPDTKPKSPALTMRQILVAVAVGVVVFGGVFLALSRFGL